MRFLYAVATSPKYYGVEGVIVGATSEEGQTKVRLTVQAPLLLWGEGLGGMLDPKTGEPVQLVSGSDSPGKELYSKEMEELKTRGMDEQAIMAKALAEMGLPEATPTPEPAATPGK